MIAQVERAIAAFTKAFQPKFTGVLQDVQAAAGNAAAKVLNAQLGASTARAARSGRAPDALLPRAAKTDRAEFEATNPRAQKWVEDHALEAIDDINDSTRSSIKDLLSSAFEGDFDVDDLTDKIGDLIGDDNRADLIARTETMTAANAGQQELWDQAVDDGLLTGNEEQEWIVTPDDRLCPICSAMEGVNVPLGDLFDVDGDQIEAPPAHPRCRCVVALTV